MGYLQQLPAHSCMPDRNQSKLLMLKNPTAVDPNCMSGMDLVTGLVSLVSIQSINQFTFPVFRTHQGSQQTMIATSKHKRQHALQQ